MLVVSLKPNGYSLFYTAVVFENVSRIGVMVIRTPKCYITFLDYCTDYAIFDLCEELLLWISFLSELT